MLNCFSLSTVKFMHTVGGNHVRVCLCSHIIAHAHTDVHNGLPEHNACCSMQVLLFCSNRLEQAHWPTLHVPISNKTTCIASAAMCCCCYHTAELLLFVW